jgi:uncharacterized protein YabE (DUF348 family)
MQETDRFIYLVDYERGTMIRIFEKFWHFDIRKYFTSTMPRKVAGIFIIAAVATLMTAEIRYLIPSRVTVVYASVDSGDKKVELETRAGNVEGALEDLKEVKNPGFKISSIDKVTPGRNQGVKNGMTVHVKEAVKTTAVIGGKEEEFHISRGTVADNLKANGIEYSDQDIVTPALDTEVTRDTKVQVQRVEKETKDVTETIPAGEESVLDPSLPSGKVVTSDGQDGQAIYTVTTTYTDGAKTSEEKALKETVKEMTNKGIRFGTSATGQSGAVNVVRTFTGNTTAYYAGEGARGSTGGICKYGTCAVDPSVIPYGTRLYIEGYGFAVANDCGGAVKGNVVDLYMNSTAQCISWGRRHVKVYVLG